MSERQSNPVDAGDQLPVALAVARRRSLWLLGAILVLWLLAFHEALWSMVEIWSRSDTFGHGFLIVPIALFLLWERRQILARQCPAGAPWALVAVVGSVLLWFVGRVAGALVVQEFAALFVLQSAVLAVVGWRMFLTLIFPLGYLLLMVPFGEFLVPPLQDFTAAFVVKALRLMDVPVFSDGIFIQIPNGLFLVAEACAGLRFLVATFALGVLFVGIAYRDWWRRAVFMVLVFVISVIANGFRALGIVLLAYHTDNQVAIEADHVIYGWVFLSIVTVALLGVGMALRGRGERPAPPLPPIDTASRPGRLTATGIAAAILVAAAPALAAVLEPRAASQAQATRLDPPPVSAPWTVVPADGADWAPSFPGATAEAVARYSDGTRSVDLFVAFYAQQSQGAEIINPNNRVATEPDWTRAADRPVGIVVDGRAVEAIETRFVGIGGRQRLVLQWYWVGGRMVGNSIDAKLYQLWGIVSGQPQAAAIVVATDGQESTAAALETLQGFLASLPALGTVLEQAGGS